MKRSDSLLLGDMLESIDRIQTYTGHMTEAEFSERSQTQDAVVRRIEIIGEASKNISFELKEQHSEVRWRDIAGATDVLVHQYFRVDLELAWEMIQEDLPALRDQLEKIRSELDR